MIITIIITSHSGSSVNSIVGNSSGNSSSCNDDINDHRALLTLVSYSLRGLHILLNIHLSRLVTRYARSRLHPSRRHPRGCFDPLNNRNDEVRNFLADTFARLALNGHSCQKCILPKFVAFVSFNIKSVCSMPF